MARGLKYGGRTIAVLGMVLLLFVVYQLWGTSLQYARAQSGLRDDFSSLLAKTAAFRDGTDGSAATSSATAISSGTAMLSAGAAELSSGTAQLRASAQTLSSSAAPSAPEEAETAGTEAAEAPEPEAAEAAEAAETALGKTVLVSPGTRLPRAEIENANLVYTPGAEEILPLLYPGDGKAVARIIIPAIKMDEIVVEGTDVDALRKGPGHYSWTPLPGQPGNASIAGHRTTYGAPFANIGNLRPNDRITVQTAQGEFIYEVLSQDLPTKGYLIVSPDRVDLLRDKGNNLLTLTSCHPRFSNRQRIVVQARLLGDPVVPMRNLNQRQDAPQELASEDLTEVAVEAGETDAAVETDVAVETDAAERTSAAGGDEISAVSEGEAIQTGSVQTENIQTGSVASEAPGANSYPDAFNAGPEVSASGNAEVGASFGSGLSGERSAIPSAVLWFVATAILWAAVWLVGTRWRRMPSVAIGILPVLGCLFVAFSYLDRALPSY